MRSSYRPLCWTVSRRGWRDILAVVSYLVLRMLVVVGLAVLMLVVVGLAVLMLVVVGLALDKVDGTRDFLQLIGRRCRRHPHMGHCWKRRQSSPG